MQIILLKQMQLLPHTADKSRRSCLDAYNVLANSSVQYIYFYKIKHLCNKYLLLKYKKKVTKGKH